MSKNFAMLYDRIGTAYARARRADPRWARAIDDALGDARSVLNVGAGTGSYEPDTCVAGVDPSLTMLRQRPKGAAPAVCAVAEALPFPDKSVDAALGVLTAHHWTDPVAGFAEMRRVARARIVIVTADVFRPNGFWLTRDYFPEINAFDRAHMPTTQLLIEQMGGGRIIPLPVPHDCIDGFCGAYWRRPEAYLDEHVRLGISRFQQIDPRAVSGGLARLRKDLASGEWHQKYGYLMTEEEIDLGYQIVIAELSP